MYTDKGLILLPLQREGYRWGGFSFKATALEFISFYLCASVVNLGFMKPAVVGEEGLSIAL